VTTENVRETAAFFRSLSLNDRMVLVRLIGASLGSGAKLPDVDDVDDPRTMRLFLSRLAAMERNEREGFLTEAAKMPVAGAPK